MMTEFSFLDVTAIKHKTICFHSADYYKTQETPVTLDLPHYPRVSLHCPQMLSWAQAIDLYWVISILGRKDKTWACCQTLDSN